MRETRLYRYLLPAEAFELREPNAGYWMSAETVEPLTFEPVGDLLDALVAAHVEIHVLPSLWPPYEDVVAWTLGFSVIRWRNVAPRP